jgi:hypothetical protein
MKNIILTSTALAFTLLSINASMAAAGDLAKCYDKVIAVCNTKAHADSCARSGMKQCDKVHPKPLIVDPTSIRSNLTTH